MTYKYVKRKHHPLAPPSGRLPEHRVILYEKIGPGTHPCYLCGNPVTWTLASEGKTRTGKGVLVTDHVDSDPTNNAPENLEPSCQPCNIRHGKDAQFDGQEFLIIRGKRERAERVSCEACAKGFLALVKFRKQGDGRFCSRSCARRSPLNH